MSMVYVLLYETGTQFSEVVGVYATGQAAQNRAAGSYGGTPPEKLQADA